MKNVAHGYSRKLREATIYAPHVPIFVGMMDYALASVHNLLDDDASDGSSSESGLYSSEHQSWKCNMADLREAPIVEEATTRTPPDQLTIEQREAYHREWAEHLKTRSAKLEAE